MADEDDSVIGLENEAAAVRSPKLALYPIALNGGGTGLYSDPREFGGRSTAEDGVYVSGRSGRRGNVRFAWPAERRGELNNSTDEKRAAPVISSGVEVREDEGGGMETIDLETQEEEAAARTKIRRTSSSRLSVSSLDPWRMWSNLHTELSRLAAIRSTRAEDESSHVTLAKQNNLARGNVIASVYNQDDFDFVLVLSPNEAYAFWARYLDFRDEALCYCYNDEEADDGSTIATNQENNSMQNNNEVCTPSNSSGLRRRRTNNNATANSKLDSKHKSSSKKTSTPSQQTPLFSASSNGISPVPKPSMMISAQKRTTFHQKSLFERAVDKFSPTRFSIGGNSKRDITTSNSENNTPIRGDTPERKDAAYYSTGGKLRRRWGNQDYDSNILSTPNLTSPPIRSLKSGRLGSTARRARKGVLSSGKTRTSSLRKTRSLFESAEKSGKRGRETMLDAVASMDETDGDDFFASPGIPRGVGEYLQ